MTLYRVIGHQKVKQKNIINSNLKKIFWMAVIVTVSVSIGVAKADSLGKMDLVENKLTHEVSNEIVEIITCDGVINPTASEIEQLGLTPENIKIANANIDLPVYSIPLNNGTWEVMEGVANYAEGSSLISNKPGNTGIFGHDRRGVFSSIKKVSEGDLVSVFAKNFRADYIVTYSFVAKPDDVEVFDYNYDDAPSLTLVTCDGRLSDKRYIVQAQLTSIQELHCNEK